MRPEGLGPAEGSLFEPYGQRLGGEVGQHHGEDSGLSGTAARPQLTNSLISVMPA